MRLLPLAALALTAQAATITTTGPGFTIGPVSFSNVTYTNAASEGLAPMGFTFHPEVYPAQDFGINAVLTIPGFYSLDADPTVQQSVTETLTADFTVSGGYQVTSVSGRGTAYTDGYGTQEYIRFNAPCQSYMMDPSSSGYVSGGCATPPTQSGTLSVALSIQTDPVCAMFGPNFCHTGYVQVSYLELGLRQLQQTPEPGTWLMVGIGIALTARLRLVTRPS